MINRIRKLLRLIARLKEAGGCSEPVVFMRMHESTITELLYYEPDTLFTGYELMRMQEYGLVLYNWETVKETFSHG
jgi:hypothetical protein